MRTSVVTFALLVSIGVTIKKFMAVSASSHACSSITPSMLIAETLSLIALDPLTGQTRPKLAPLHDQHILACALLMELAVQTRIGLRNGVVSGFVVASADAPIRGLKAMATEFKGPGGADYRHRRIIQDRVAG